MVALVYGYGEGGWSGAYFRRALEQAGFAYTDNVSQADIVISHSAGCFYLPESAKHDQLTVLIGPPFWPDRSVIANSFRKFGHDFAAYRRDSMTKAWLTKSFWNSLYIVSAIPRALAMWRHARRQDFYRVLRNKQVVIIRAEYDDFMTPEADKLLSGKADFRFYSIPGHQHDDLWRYPELYLVITRKEYGFS